MGKKSKRKNKERLQKLEKMFDDIEEDMTMTDLNEGRRLGAKKQSKLNKKERKRQLRQMMQMKVKPNKETENKIGWNKVLIKGDSPLEREFILTSIHSIIDMEFHPLGFFRIDNSSCFYLENNEQAAAAIAGLDKRLQGPSGCRLKITNSKVDGPDLVLNSDQLQILRQCLAGRYNKDSHLLDLSDLHNDVMLKERDILTPLQTPSIMKQVLKLVKENVPDLKALSLSKNSLKRSHLHNLQVLLSGGKSQLTALNLEHNIISDLKVLNLIKTFPLTELNMQFNPIVESYKDRPVSYIKEVRARLHNLKLLDNIDIDTYLAANDKPSPHKVNSNFSHNEKVLADSSSNSEFEVTDATVRVFLDQYYAIVDTPERLNLVAAYTPDAVLEVKSNVEFISNNVFVGHDKIREALTSLPATQHDHSSFNFTIQPLGQKITRAEVTGQCRLAGVNSPVAFLKIMNIVPFNTGFCCSQDKLELRVIGT